MDFLVSQLDQLCDKKKALTSAAYFNANEFRERFLSRKQKKRTSLQFLFLIANSLLCAGIQVNRNDAALIKNSVCL